MSGPNAKTRAISLPIGGLSAETGVHVETIRYYERIGLLPAPPRSSGRHRVYGEAHRRRLAFIRRARELGFSLEEVRILLGLGSGHDMTCAEVRALTHHHVAAIRTKIRDLKRLERILSTLAAQCNAENVPDCPILDTLNAANARPAER